jgi:hypothetical protein
LNAFQQSFGYQIVKSADDGAATRTDEGSQYSLGGQPLSGDEEPALRGISDGGGELLVPGTRTQSPAVHRDGRPPHVLVHFATLALSRCADQAGSCEHHGVSGWPEKED